MEMNLTDNEMALILILRKFDFLRQNDYSIKELLLYGKDHYLIFENTKIRQKLYIEWAPSNSLEIKCTRMLLFGGGTFELKDIYKHYESGYSLKDSIPIYVTMEKVIDLNVNFIQQNLMPVIRGEIWISELLKQKRSYLSEK